MGSDENDDASDGAPGARTYEVGPASRQRTRVLARGRSRNER